MVILGSGNAWAEATDTANEILITGTLIRGTGPVGGNVTTLNREAIEPAGVVTTTELLRQLPQIQNLGGDESHLNASQGANTNFTVGSGINLRGLGTESTLLLFNGRRIPASGTRGAFTDPSLIPANAVGRVDVVSDGASATYGSDAVGGVVNFSTRRNYVGAETTAGYGEADGLHQIQYSQLFGTKWNLSGNEGSFMFAYDHNERSLLQAKDRPAAYTEDFRAHGGPDLRSTNANPGTIQVGNTSYAIPANQNGVGLTASQLVAGTSNRQSSNVGTAALPAQTRDTLFASLRQNLTPSLEVFLEALNSKRAFLRYASLSNQVIVVPKSNPFFVSPNVNAQTVSVNYSFIPVLGAQKLTGYVKLNTLTTGANVELGNDWHAEAFITQGRDWERRWTDNSINVAALSAALADPNPATAFNPFADGTVANTNNPATLDKIRANAINAPTSELLDGGFKLDGPLGNLSGGMLPAGKIRIALGGEYTKTGYRYAQYQSTTTPNNSTFAEVINLATSRKVKSFFSEVYVPLIGANNTLPFAKQLEFSVAARYDDYNDFGSTTNPKFGMNWMPVDNLTLRATYGKSFRVPNGSEQAPEALGTISLNTLTDPASPTGSSLTLRVQGGNPRVKPEAATISTFGVSSAFYGVDLLLDYFKVDYKDRLSTPGNDSFILTKLSTLGRYVIAAPTAAQVNALTAIPYFQGVRPDPATVKYIVDAQSDNLGSVKTHGVDFVLRTHWQDAANTAWNIGFSGTYMFSYKQTTVPGQVAVNVLNTINNPMRLRGRGELGWQRNDLRLTAFVNYVNRYINNGVTPLANVKAWTTLDLSARYDLGNSSAWLKGTSLSFNAQNIADRAPPFVQNGNFSFDAQNASAIGRMMTIGVAMKW